ncbi:MAG TPA: antibiotic biosynthesis monooxygenase [Candidatus Acidoferrales bacterium]|nr:antibiotic biosynthesis monooxygenase [Candidatus Acidoferrales bacterium]
MVARVTHYRIRPEKLQEFTATVQSLTAALHKLKGFRVLFVLRGDDPSSQEAMAISIWDST